LSEKWERAAGGRAARGRELREVDECHDFYGVLGRTYHESVYEIEDLRY
jgi:hypothetical protein